MSDQEREALKELVRLQGHGGLTYPCCNRAWSAAWEKAEAALAAREDTKQPEEEHEEMLDLLEEAIWAVGVNPLAGKIQAILLKYGR